MQSGVFLLDSKGAKVCKSCRSRKMQKNRYVVAKICVDTTENEPFKVCWCIHAPPTPGHKFLSAHVSRRAQARKDQIAVKRIGNHSPGGACKNVFHRTTWTYLSCIPSRCVLISGLTSKMCQEPCSDSFINRRDLSSDALNQANQVASPL